MTLRAVLLLTSLLLAPLSALAADPTFQVNQTMTEIGAIMSNLLGEKVLADPDATLKDLDQLGERFQKIGPHVGERGPAFRITWETMNEQIDRARDAVQKGDATPESLRNLVHGIASVCAGCHTQDDKVPVFSFGKLAPATTDPLQRARFSYITRNYADALKEYDEYLDAQPRIAYNGQVLDAIEGELTIYAQIYRDPDRAIAALKKRLDHSGGSMSKQVRSDIQAWMKGFDELHKQKIKAFEPTYTELEGYVKRFILPHDGAPIITEEKDKIAYLWMRGLLHEYVQAHPTDPHMPELLYWLALTDRVLDYNFYYSLADLYLKECIVRYPGTATAELCYDEYEKYVDFAYSGSGGEYVPEDVRDELHRLRDILDKALQAQPPAAEPAAPGATAPATPAAAPGTTTTTPPPLAPRTPAPAKP